ncbi:MAG: CYTH domain-containing protein [Candidatus Absconditabacteria bacterium]
MNNGNEVEGKILEVNKDLLVDKLVGLGANEIAKTLVISEFFETNETINKGNNYSNKIIDWLESNNLLNGTNLKLRLRSIDGKVEITHKGVSESKELQDRIELNLLVDDFENAKGALAELGFKLIIRNEKQRISYELGDIRFDFDKYNDIPWLVEVESNSKEKVIQGAIILGYGEKDLKNLSITQLYKYYGK